MRTKKVLDKTHFSYIITSMSHSKRPSYNTSKFFTTINRRLVNLLKPILVAIMSMGFFIFNPNTTQTQLL